MNGTTVGNHAMVASTTGPGDKVLIARNCHRSVLTGLIMSGAQPIFFQPTFDRDLKLTLNVTFDTVREAIDANPGARALLITSPNYYGLCADIEKITTYAHEKGLLVFVDEAHGPHLKFHPKLPKCALEAGADMCVQSTHKIVGGMTQASMLHANAGRVNLDDVTNTLKAPPDHEPVLYPDGLTRPGAHADGHGRQKAAHPDHQARRGSPRQDQY